MAHSGEDRGTHSVESMAHSGEDRGTHSVESMAHSVESMAHSVESMDHSVCWYLLARQRKLVLSVSKYCHMLISKHGCLRKTTIREFAGLASSRLARNVAQWLPDHRSTSMTQQHLYAKRASIHRSRLARNVAQWLPDHRSTSMTQQHLYAERASIHLVQEDAGRQGLIVACSPLRAFLSGVVQHALMREQLPATPRRRDCLCASYRCSAA